MQLTGRQDGVVESALSERFNVNHANHLPADFFLKRNTTSFDFYIGLHTADGLNSSNSNFIGIAFKSSECIFLWNFLKSICVEAPKLNFQPKRDTFSKKFGAGYHGAVRWGFSNKDARGIIWSLGFPSSNIKDSLPRLIEDYFADEDDIKLIVFLLGFFAGDGTISYSYAGSHKMDLEARFRELVFVARDDFIPSFFTQKLEALDFHCTLRKFPSPSATKGYINRLLVLQSPGLIKLILNGLQTFKVEKVYIDGKLSLLAQYTVA